jgi:hypothetical protein
MTQVLADALPGRRVHVIADSAYAGQELRKLGQVLQGPRQPVQRRHDQGVLGGHEGQACGELGPVGVTGIPA